MTVHHLEKRRSVLEDTDVFSRGPQYRDFCVAFDFSKPFLRTSVT
jgi:hypothetical protein